MAKGYTYREIADKLFIANGTVRMHAESIMKKFWVRQRSELPRSYDRRLRSVVRQRGWDRSSGGARPGCRRLDTGTLETSFTSRDRPGDLRPGRQFLAEVPIFEDGKDE
jgi:Bacterial regulatory proteins, luxR family